MQAVEGRSVRARKNPLIALHPARLELPLAENTPSKAAVADAARLIPAFAADSSAAALKIR